jgi:hypothetical protein
MFSADQIWNNLLKEIARQAFQAGEAYDDYIAGIGQGYSPQETPDFEEWWAAFVEQNHTDG